MKKLNVKIRNKPEDDPMQITPNHRISTFKIILMISLGLHIFLLLIICIITNKHPLELYQEFMPP
jgi:hypothetical protein